MPASRALTCLPIVLAVGLCGCQSGRRHPGMSEPPIAVALRPLLELQPQANWTSVFNALLPHGAAAMDYLAGRPVMQRPAAPDDLRVMVHTSLMRLLAVAPDAPHLSVNCFETTLDVLHFDPKVSGRPLGTVFMPQPRPPAAWHELYPADFDHRLAARIDLESDRLAMLRWWNDHRAAPVGALRTLPLRPQPQYLWTVLSRRYADRWVYEPTGSTMLCSTGPRLPTLIDEPCYDYNLVRAVCLWLATCRLPEVQDRLIETVAAPSPIVAYNARFALRNSPDHRIREVIERLDPLRRRPPAGDRIRTVGSPYNPGGSRDKGD